MSPSPMMTNETCCNLSQPNKKTLQELVCVNFIEHDIPYNGR